MPSVVPPAALTFGQRVLLGRQFEVGRGRPGEARTLRKPDCPGRSGSWAGVCHLEDKETRYRDKVERMVDNSPMIKQSPPPDLSRPGSARNGSRDLLSQRTRTVTSSCYACSTPLTLTCVLRGGVWVVYCTLCGVVRPPTNDLVSRVDMVRQLPFTFFS